MGCLVSAKAVVAAAMARVMDPPPPPDITRWCEDNIVFDERSPMPGPFRVDRFPFLREIHDVLSPEHLAREVTILGSAQWGKTVSIINPVVGAWHEYGPVDSLVVHPTHSSATEWIDNKWLPMRRQAPSLLKVFGDGRSGDQRDAKFNQETLARNGSLKVTSAGSPDDLAGTTRRLVVMDDVAKFEMHVKGDPEALAVSRASAFEDAKIVRVSTPQILGTCRISRAFARSDQRHFHVPCPHCEHYAPLTWENFKRNIDPQDLSAAHFRCDQCGQKIEHKHKRDMVTRGRWVAQNPGGDHPGFFLWRAYVPQLDWRSIAVNYAQLMGWSTVSGQDAGVEGKESSVEAETEQTFFNDVLGLPYEQATNAPKWEKIRDRVEHPDEGEHRRGRGIVPARGVILSAGVDLQADRIEVHVVAFGPNFRRWVVDYLVIPYQISDPEGSDALDALLKSTWRTERGLRLKLDIMVIDSGAFTDAAWTYAKRHPWSRVILIKGAKGDTGPIMAEMKFERRADGRVKRRQKRAFMLNVSQMKGEFYHALEETDPLKRGFVDFPLGLGDEYYRQITSEVRVIRRSSSGVPVSKWVPVEASRRNEGLDTMNYAEAGARRKQWATLSAEDWALLDQERGAAPQDAEPELFDQMAAKVEPVNPPRNEAGPAENEPKATEPVRDDWLGGRGSGWQL